MNRRRPFFPAVIALLLFGVMTESLAFAQFKALFPDIPYYFPLIGLYPYLLAGAILTLQRREHTTRGCRFLAAAALIGLLCFLIPSRDALLGATREEVLFLYPLISLLGMVPLLIGYGMALLVIRYFWLKP